MVREILPVLVSSLYVAGLWPEMVCSRSEVAAAVTNRPLSCTRDPVVRLDRDPVRLPVAAAGRCNALALLALSGPGSRLSPSTKDLTNSKPTVAVNAYRGMRQGIARLCCDLFVIYQRSRSQTSLKRGFPSQLNGALWPRQAKQANLTL